MHFDRTTLMSIAVLIAMTPLASYSGDWRSMSDFNVSEGTPMRSRSPQVQKYHEAGGKIKRATEDIQAAQQKIKAMRAQRVFVDKMAAAQKAKYTVNGTKILARLMYQIADTLGFPPLKSQANMILRRPASAAMNAVGELSEGIAETGIEILKDTPLAKKTQPSVWQDAEITDADADTWANDKHELDKMKQKIADSEEYIDKLNDHIEYNEGVIEDAKNDQKHWEDQEKQRVESEHKKKPEPDQGEGESTAEKSDSGTPDGEENMEEVLEEYLGNTDPDPVDLASESTPSADTTDIPELNTGPQNVPGGGGPNWWLWGGLLGGGSLVAIGAGGSGGDDSGNGNGNGNGSGSGSTSIVGTWTSSSSGGSGTVKFRDDGSYVSNGANILGPGGSSGSISEGGTWTVSGSTLRMNGTMTITQQAGGYSSTQRFTTTFTGTVHSSKKITGSGTMKAQAGGVSYPISATTMTR